MTARVDALIGRAEIRTPARLSQRLARTEQSWSDDFPLSQEAGNLVIRPARLSNRREPVHEAVPQVARGSKDDFRRGIGDVLRTQGKPRDMGMRIDQTRHERSAGDVDHRRISRMDGVRGHRIYVTTTHKNIQGCL